MEQVIEIIRQINQLSGSLLDALEQGGGGGEASGGAPGGPPPEGAPAEEEPQRGAPAPQG
jgi:hypothetical protein